MLFVIGAKLTVPVTGLKSLLATAMGAMMARVFSSVHAIPHGVQHVLDRPVCNMLYLGLTLSSCVVHVLLCDIMWPEVESRFDDSHEVIFMSFCMSCIHLVSCQHYFSHSLNF